MCLPSTVKVLGLIIIQCLQSLHTVVNPRNAHGFLALELLATTCVQWSVEEMESEKGSHSVLAGNHVVLHLEWWSAEAINLLVWTCPAPPSKFTNVPTGHLWVLDIAIQIFGPFGALICPLVGHCLIHCSGELSAWSLELHCVYFHRDSPAIARIVVSLGHL